MSACCIFLHKKETLFDITIVHHVVQPARRDPRATSDVHRVDRSPFEEKLKLMRLVMDHVTSSVKPLDVSKPLTAEYVTFVFDKR